MKYQIRAFAILGRKQVIVPVELLWQRSTVEEAIYLGFLRQSRGRNRTTRDGAVHLS